jgi:hypothetical protein
MNDDWKLIKNESEFNEYKSLIFMNDYIQSVPREYPCFVFDYINPDETPEIEILYISDLENMIISIM